MQELLHTPPSASKTQILDAAARVFMLHGVDVASIDDVARDLGATKGRIYHHFPSKGVLVAEVCLRAADFTYRKVAPVIDPAAPADENLRVMIRTHVPEVLRTLPYHKVIRQAYTGCIRNPPPPPNAPCTSASMTNATGTKGCSATRYGAVWMAAPSATRI